MLEYGFLNRRDWAYKQGCVWLAPPQLLFFLAAFVCEYTEEYFWKNRMF